MKQIITVLAFLILSLTLHAAPTAVATQTEFDTNYRSDAANLLASPEIQKLRDYHFILVTGFLNEVQTKLGFGNFNPQMDVLKSLGISYELMTYDEARIATSARTLSERILRSSKPVVLMAHSLGVQVALETLLVDGAFNRINTQGEASRALMELCKDYVGPDSKAGPITRFIDRRLGKSPEDCVQAMSDALPTLRWKVRGLIALNGNVAGTPLADLLFNPEVRSLKKRLLLRFLNFRPTEVTANIMEMSEQVAQARLREQSDKLDEMTSELPVISVASFVDLNSAQRKARFTYRLGEILKRQGVQSSDGVVPTTNSMIPGSEVIVVPYASHFETIKDYPTANAADGTTYDPRQGTLVLLKMMAARIFGCASNLNSNAI
jgi:hypothetical protein